MVQPIIESLWAGIAAIGLLQVLCLLQLARLGGKLDAILRLFPRRGRFTGLPLPDAPRGGPKLKEQLGPEVRAKLRAEKDQRVRKALLESLAAAHRKRQADAGAGNHHHRVPVRASGVDDSDLIAGATTEGATE